MPTNNKLKHYPVRHAGRRNVMHPELGREIQAQTAVCYLRFLRNVKVDYLEIPTVGVGSGRWVPNVPTHPAHLLVSALDHEKNEWKLVQEVELPFNPKFAGEGLSQET